MVVFNIIKLTKQAFKINGFENLEFLPLIIQSAALYSPHRHDPHEGDNIAFNY